jgi:hypothetical protein
MATDHATLRHNSFASAPLGWLVAHHFLPAELLAEYCRALVETAGPDRVSFDQLFESQLGPAPEMLRAWIVKPRPLDDDALHRTLQGAVRRIMWQGDDPTYPAMHTEIGPEAEFRNDLSAAFELARADVGSIAGWSKGFKNRAASLQIVARAISALRDFVEATEGDISSVDLRRLTMTDEIRSAFEFPLNGLLTKHLGDLAADADRPDVALALYDAAEAQFRDADAPAWTSFRDEMLTILLQSRAAMLRLSEGPKAAAVLLNTAIAETDLKTAPLLQLNATLDALDAEQQAHENMVTFVADVRPAIIWSPQVQLSHTLGNAFSRQAQQEYHEASRWFWAGLRRLIALGSSNQTRLAKAVYALNMLEELEAVRESESHPGTFRTLVRLLLESERQELAKKVQWSHSILAGYLDESSIRDAISHAAHVEGARGPRLLVLIALARGWLKDMPRENLSAALALIDFLAETALSGALPSTRRDVAIEIFEVIEATAVARPEFRRLGADSLVAAIAKQLHSRDFRIWIAAFKAGQALVDALPEPALRALLAATLTRLETLTPATASWPVIAPAISILSDEASRKLWPGDARLAERSAATILRYGLEDESENSRLLALFGDIGPFLPPDAVADTRLEHLVQEVRLRSKEINSSAAISNISALLLAPTLSRVAGIHDAVDGIRMILASPTTGQSTMSVAFAYRPVMILTQRRQQIEPVLGAEAYKTLLGTLVDPIVGLWKAAIEQPTLLAPFSIPEPTTPHSTVVHNWTFASVGFARLLGVEARIDKALAEAAKVPSLATAIAVGRAARLTAEDAMILDLDDIAAEPTPAFYAALGQRIVSLRAIDDETQARVLSALAQQCLRHGPNGLDAVVFALARDQAVALPINSLDYQVYRERLDANRDLRIGLTPILDDLVSKPG